MARIVLARIDDRLIHGQVMTAWMQFVGGNHIVIVDDETAADPFLKSVLEMAVPREIKLDVFGCDAAAEEIARMGEAERVVILAKGSACFLRLIETGLPLKKVVIGGMGACADRTKFYKNISASEAERGAFREIMARGVALVIHIIPDQTAVDVAEFLK